MRKVEGEVVLADGADGAVHRGLFRDLEVWTEEVRSQRLEVELQLNDSRAGELSNVHGQVVVLPAGVLVDDTQVYQGCV